jgi:ATP-binding cassette subfamily A (ABC1) protein 3
MSENGSGNFIYNTLETRKEIEVFTVVEFLEVCRLEREVINRLRAEFGDVELLEKLQTFIRLKVKAKARVSRLFEFFESNKQKYCIQQYTIKQATVEQIFNKFAEQEEQTEFGP